VLLTTSEELLAMRGLEPLVGHEPQAGVNMVNAKEAEVF
jgi:hypothetical protein